MKCTDCGKDFEPDCAQEEICKPCQYEDVPEPSIVVFTHCNVCGIALRTRDEDEMGMCERCSNE